MAREAAEPANRSLTRRIADLPSAVKVTSALAAPGVVVATGVLAEPAISAATTHIANAVGMTPHVFDSAAGLGLGAGTALAGLYHAGALAARGNSGADIASVFAGGVIGGAALGGALAEATGGLIVGGVGAGAGIGLFAALGVGMFSSDRARPTPLGVRARWLRRLAMVPGAAVVSGGIVDVAETLGHSHAVSQAGIAEMTVASAGATAVLLGASVAERARARRQERAARSL